MPHVFRIPPIEAPAPRGHIRRAVTVLVTLAVPTSMFAFPSPVSASDTATRWDHFSESAACGDSFTRTPVASRIGSLAESEAILGPFGTYFGRSVAEVRNKLRPWTVPQSGGLRVQVHEAMLPSLQQVAAGLRAHAEDGRVYEISSAWAFTPRTIAGRYHVSRHAMGLAIDLNPAQNPFRNDAVFISDMPDWFVQTWRDAGFCWGGDWRGSKDPMHFSWMGPGATPDPNDSLTPLPPKTSKTTFRPAATHGTPFGPVLSRYSLDIIDFNTNGTSDVVGLRSHPNGSVLDIANSHSGFGQCSIGRWFFDDKSLPEADHVIFADVDGDSGQDLIALSASGSSLTATIAPRSDGFADSTDTTTGASAEAAALVGADFDGDHLADLWEATSDGRMRVWRGPAFTQLLDDSPLPDGTPARIAAGDRDGGDRPELFALYPQGNGSRIDVLANDGSWSRQTSIDLGIPVDTVAANGAGDYDGDGRADAQVLTSNGDLLAYIGNTPTGQPAGRWFIYPGSQDCDDPILFVFEGSFMDDDENTFTSNIESIAEAGVTRGCNPPFNDKFCPGDDVSREQMAAFLVRALELTANDHPGFADVPAGSTFADDIGRLATAGITRGCNPPANDRYCPKDDVSREQMAAFLVRALALTGNDHPGFADVPASSTFVDDVERLATADVTRGCNPPANTRYCPGDPVTRGQMAAFLDRAGLGR